MRLFFRYILLSYLIAITVKSQAQQLGFYVSAEVSSPAVYLDDLDGNWAATASGDYAYAKAMLGSWFQLSNNVKLGVEKRINQYLNFTPQTAYFYGQLENDQLPEGTYPLSLDINTNSTEGLFLRINLNPSQQIRFEVALHGFVGNLVQIAQLEGEGVVQGTDTYTYQYEINYQYGENRLFDQPALGVTGYGHSFDGLIEYDYNSSLTFGLEAKDLLYRLYWSPINQDAGCVARPSPEGQLCVLASEQVSITQSLPEQISIYSLYSMKAITAGVNAVWVGRHQEFWLSAKRRAGVVAYDLINEVIDIGYEYDWLAVKWAFDDFRYEKANNWQISLNAKWAFQ